MRGSMSLASIFKTKYLAIFFMSILLINTATIELNAKKRTQKNKSKITRSHNASASKKMSLDIIRKDEELAEMANLAPIIDPDGITRDHNNQIIGEIGEDLAELEKEDNFEYDAEQFQMLLTSLVDNEVTAAGIPKADILNAAIEILGTRYQFGGTLPNSGMDCSAFTRYIFDKVANITLPRTAREQINYGKVIKNKEDLQFGDLIFFHTYSRKFASHVGIYIKDGLFVHAGIRYGVAIASLNSDYYSKRFIGGRRLTEKDIEKLRKPARPGDDIQAFKKLDT